PTALGRETPGRPGLEVRGIRGGPAVTETRLSRVPSPTGPGEPPAGSGSADFPVPPPIAPEHVLNATQWGMISFLVSEVAFFSTLIVAYVTFMGKDVTPPTPAVLSLPLAIVTTICLLSSSGT